jgi:hypothetical protein
MDWDEDARDKLRQLPAAERRAVMTAVAKLEASATGSARRIAARSRAARLGSGSYGLGPGARPGGCCTGGWAER